MSEPKFTVAIIGGGIVGLTTAIALTHFTKERQDIKIDVYEATAKFADIGAGIGFFPRPWKIMKKLGCTDSLEKFLEQRPQDFPLQRTIDMRKSDFKEGISFYDLVIPCPLAGFQRSQVLQVLTDHIDPNRVTVHFSKRLTSYVQAVGAEAPIEMSFMDGSTAKADVLIGCDGIHSPVRHMLLKSVADKLEASGDGGQAASLRNSADAVWSGSICYRALVPRAKLEALNPNHRSLSVPVLYAGKNKHIHAIPIAHKTLVNFGAFVTWPEKAGTKYEGPTVEETGKEQLLQYYEGWEDEVQELLRCIEHPKSWVINQLPHLSTWTAGRVAIAGDAAHAMTPHQGSGAGQGVEDAYILAMLLAHPLTTLKSLPEALKIYEEMRLPIANDVHQRSEGQGRLYDFLAPESAVVQDFGKNGPLGEDDAGKLWNVGHTICDRWKWAWTTSVGDSEEQAVRMLESRLANSK